MGGSIWRTLIFSCVFSYRSFDICAAFIPSAMSFYNLSALHAHQVIKLLYSKQANILRLIFNVKAMKTKSKFAHTLLNSCYISLIA